MTNYVKSIFSYFGSFFGKNCNPPEKSDGINESLANAQPTNISSSSSSSSSRVPNRGLNNYSISSSTNFSMAGIPEKVKNVVAKFRERMYDAKQLSCELLNTNDDDLDNELNKLIMDSEDFEYFEPDLVQCPNLIEKPIFKRCCLGYFCLCKELNKLQSFSETEIENLFLFNTLRSGLISINQLLRFIRSINDENTKFVKEILTDFGNKINQASIDRSKENLGTPESLKKIHAAFEKSKSEILQSKYGQSQSSNAGPNPAIKWYTEVSSDKSDGINESLANAQPTNISSSSSSSSSRVPNRGLNNYSISSSTDFSMAGISQEVRNVVAKFSEWQGGVKQLSRELLNANDDNLDNELNKLTMDSKDFVCFRPKLMEFPDLIQDPLFKQCCLGYFCLCQELNKLKSFSETEIENLFLFNTTGSGLININQLLRFIRSINDDNTKFVKEILTDFGNAITQAGIDRSKENLGTSESFEKIHAALDKSIWKIFKDGYEESKSSNVELSPRIKWYIEVFKKDSFKIYNEETRPTVNSHTDKAKSPNIISNFSTNRRRAAYFSSVVDQLRKNGLEDEFWPKHVIICEFVDKCTTGMTLLFPREYSAYAPVLIGGKLGLLDRLAYFWRKCTHKLWGLRKINGPCTGESYADTLAHECGHYLHCQIVDLAAKREVFEKYAIGLENYERLSRFYTPQRYDACLNYVPRKIAPQEVAPQEVAPQEVAPQEVAPQEVAPQEVALQEVAPQEVAPQEVAPQEVAPQEVVDMRKMIMEEVSIYACSHADGSEFVAETFAILLMQKKKLSQPIIELYVALNGPIIPEIKRLIDSFGYTNIQVAVNIPETPEDVNESAEIQERSEDDRETEDF